MIYRHRHYRDNRLLAIGVLAFIVACGFAAAMWPQPRPAAAINGYIDSRGYHAAPNTEVTWRRPGAPDRKTTINEAVQWDGSNADGDGPLVRWFVRIDDRQLWADSRAGALEIAITAGVPRDVAETMPTSVPCRPDEPGPQCLADPKKRPYICRFGDCDASLLGREITGAGSEQAAVCIPDCSRDSGNLLNILLRDAGLNRAATRQEYWDFSISNFGRARRYLNACDRSPEKPFGTWYSYLGSFVWQDYEKILGRCFPQPVAGWQSTLGCWSACSTPDGLPPGLGPAPTPAPSATPRATPCQCGSSRSGAGGVVVCNDCPPPAATPTPPAPDATPSPTPPPVVVVREVPRDCSRFSPAAADLPAGAELRARIASRRNVLPRALRPLVDRLLVLGDGGDGRLSRAEEETGDKALAGIFGAGLTVARCWSGGQAGPEHPELVPAADVQRWLVDMLSGFPEGRLVAPAAAAMPAEVVKAGYLEAVTFWRSRRAARATR